MLERLAKRTTPKTVVDIGASNGQWSAMAKKVWPSAKFLLVEANPVFEDNLKAYCKLSGASYSLSLAGANSGLAACGFCEENPYQGVDLTENSSLVTVETIDKLLDDRGLPGPYLLKFDVHGHEIPILWGARETLKDTGAIVMEVYGWRQGHGSLRFWEMCSYLEGLGFGSSDLCEPLYRPYDGRLSQVDMAFERLSAPGMNTSRYE
jgi:FkbM family methyltransferase